MNNIFFKCSTTCVGAPLHVDAPGQLPPKSGTDTEASIYNEVIIWHENEIELNNLISACIPCYTF